MVRLFQFLRDGCFHEYEIIKESRLDYSYYNGKSGTCVRYALRCKKCGSMKIFDAR